MSASVKYPFDQVFRSGSPRDKMDWGGFEVRFDTDEGVLSAYDNKIGEHFGGGEVYVELTPSDAVRLGEEMVSWGKEHGA